MPKRREFPPKPCPRAVQYLSEGVRRQCAGRRPSRTSLAAPRDPRVLSPHRLLGAAIFLPRPPAGERRFLSVTSGGRDAEVKHCGWRCWDGDPWEESGRKVGGLSPFRKRGEGARCGFVPRKKGAGGRRARAARSRGLPASSGGTRSSCDGLGPAAECSRAVPSSFSGVVGARVAGRKRLLGRCFHPPV